VKFTISIPRESCTNAKAKYSSSVVPPDPSVHFYHRVDGIHRATVTQFQCHLAFAAILWVKLLEVFFHCDIAEIRFVGKIVITQTFS